MIPLRIGDVRVEIHDGWTRTVFPDGTELHGHHAAQPGQEETAKELGYPNAETMNRDHDLAHSLFAYWMGLPHSGSLYAAAAKIKPTDIHWLEEAAVLSLQAFAVAKGVDLVLLARQITAQCEADR